MRGASGPRLSRIDADTKEPRWGCVESVGGWFLGPVMSPLPGCPSSGRAWKSVSYPKELYELLGYPIFHLVKSVFFVLDHAFGLVGDTSIKGLNLAFVVGWFMMAGKVNSSP